MIDGSNLGRIPVGEARRLYARMIGKAGNMWLGVGRIEKTAEGLEVRWDEDGRAAAPAWELATGRWPEGDREVVEFGVIEQGRMLRVARCRLTGWAVRESRWGR